LATTLSAKSVKTLENLTTESIEKAKDMYVQAIKTTTELGGWLHGSYASQNIGIDVLHLAAKHS
jgi:hypothetical protein